MYPHALSVMVGLMRGEPTAGLGISLLRRHTGGPVPMLLSPRMSYQREFLGAGLFSGGPGSAIVRRSVFEMLGGFIDAGNASDDLFWLHACARVDVLLLPADLTWFRVHDTRASNSPASSEDYFVVTREAWKAIDAADCPLTLAERVKARDAIAVRLAKRMVRDVFRGRGRRALRRFRAAGIAVPRFVSHLKPLRLSPVAGTPLSSSGEFVVPEWMQPARRRLTE